MSDDKTDKTDKTVKVIKVEGDVPVPFWRDNDEHNCYITLTEDGQLYAEEDHLGRAVTFDQWHRRELNWVLSPNLTIEQVNVLLEVVAPLAQQVHEGHSVVWDGSNHVGVLTEEAQQAREAIEAEVELVNQDPEGMVYDSAFDFGPWDEVAQEAAGLQGEDLEGWVRAQVQEVVEVQGDPSKAVVPESVITEAVELVSELLMQGE